MQVLDNLVKDQVNVRIARTNTAQISIFDPQTARYTLIQLLCLQGEDEQVP